ncbi:MAG: hypothetical protein HY211_04460 [Candidatus Omnitrophica bacterium]|nr:hypothetical protein [Candidatus Omnitrophota bacterium]
MKSHEVVEVKTTGLVETAERMHRFTGFSGSKQLLEQDFADLVARYGDPPLKKISFRRLDQVGETLGKNAAGAEEIQSVFNRLVQDPTVQQPLQEKGWISLEPGQVGAFGYQAVGGFIIADSAKITDASHAVIADEDLTNEAARRLLTWIAAGRGPAAVVRNAHLFNARRGDLILLKATPELTADQVKRLLAENGLDGAEAVHTVVGDNVQVKNLSIFAFQLLASQNGLPSVVVLSVAVRLRDEQGNNYTLVLMA